MRKTFLKVGAFYALTATILGAFGAHLLKTLLEPEKLVSFQTGVTYQFYGAFILLILGTIMYRRKNKLMDYAGWLFMIGTLLFSGSIYLLVMSSIMDLSLSFLGPVTPLGGSLLIVGWTLLLVSFFQDASNIK